MKRIPDGQWREPIGRALDTVRPYLHRLGHVQFLCGVNPAFAGLHSIATTQGHRSLSSTAHCVGAHHLSHRPRSDRVTTVVLPLPVDPRVVVHELGHALHETIGWKGSPLPVTAYARTNRWESFAEAFTAQFYLNYGDEAVRFVDGKTKALFGDLSW